MADFILTLCFQRSDEIEVEEMSTLAKLGVCLLLCGIAVGVGVFVLGLIISGLLSGLGVKDSSGASFVIAFILLFSLLSFAYVYHVGRLIEQNRKEQYQAVKQQQQMQAQQSILGFPEFFGGNELEDYLISSS